MPEISRNPPAIGRLEETLTIIEEIDARILLDEILCRLEEKEGL